MGLGHYEINEDMSQRLNIMKFVFMVCVVFIHSYALPSLPYALDVPRYVTVCKEIVVNGICRVAVDGFFFISGLLLFAKEFTWLGNMRKKAKSILVPYLLINSFWIIFFRAVNSFEMTAHYFADEAYQINEWIDVAEAYLNPMPLYYPFWFLRDLMILNIFAALIKVMIDRFPILILVIMIALQMQMLSLPLLVSNNSFCMFALGGYFVKYTVDAEKLDQISLWYIGTLFAGLILAKLYLFKDLKLIFPLYIVCGIFFYYRIAGKILESKMARHVLWCSQFTFFVYGFHEFYMAMGKRVMMSVIPQYGIIQLMEFFMLPLVISAVCIIMGAVMKKKITWLYRIVCGLR